MSSRRQDLLKRFEHAVELPLLVLALGMIPLLVVPLLVDLPNGVESTFEMLEWLVWAAFALEYVVRLGLTEKRFEFVRKQWPDLLIIVLPFLRPLRIVRSARALRLLRLGRVVVVLSETGQESRRLLLKHKLHYVLLFTGLLVMGAAALTFAVEEGGSGSIQTFGDSVWWAITTVTTVGYGDMFPVTPAGRGIAAFLMMGGIALFGVLTANLAAFMLDKDEPASEPTSTKMQLEEVIRRLDSIETRLSGLSGTSHQ